MNAPGDVLGRCASALGRAIPDDVDELVRLIVDGTAALGLPELAAPWQHDLDVAGGGHERDDEVARCLVALPQRRPVVVFVSGPVWVAASATGSDGFDQDALDDAVDLVAARVRAVADLRPDRIAALELGGECTDGPNGEAHRTLRRIADHFAIPFSIEAVDGG